MQAGNMAAAGAGRLRRAVSALLLRSPRLPARELSAPARLYHKKVWEGEGVREPSRGRPGLRQPNTPGKSGRLPSLSLACLHPLNSGPETATEDPAANSPPPRLPLGVSQL